MKKNKYRIFVLQQLYPFFKDVKKWFVCNVFISICLKLLALLVPVFYAVFIEKVLLAKKMEYLLVVVVGSVSLQIFLSVLKLWKVKCVYKVNSKVFKEVKIKVLKQYMNLKFHKYSEVKPGDMKIVVEDSVERLSAFGGAQSIDYVINAVYAGVLIVLLLEIDWRLSLLSFAFIPVTFVLDHIVGEKEKKVNGKLGENDGRFTTWLDESIKGWKEIRINRLKDKRLEEFEKIQGTEEKHFEVWIRYWTTRVLVIPKMKDEFIIQFIIYFIGGILIYKDFMTIGVLLIFAQYYGMVTNTIKELSLADANLQSDMFFYERVMESVLPNEDELTDGKYVTEKYDISFRGVSFKYPESERETISDLSFSIMEGEKVVICGASGSGKSTILKLLLGVLIPDEGKVCLGGVDLALINKKELYKKIAYISQDAILFNESIWENITLGNEQASLKEVEEACKKASIYDYVKTLPEGFDTIIGENGSLLSGGQRQRLILARAFLKNAKIYVFDEATSALDMQVEGEIERVIEGLPSDKTVIVVTHREFGAANKIFIVK